MKKNFPIGNRQSAIINGFTLVEILLVVVIILIATAVAVPVFRGTFQSTQMKDAVRSTVRLTRYARSLAILRQSDCTLHFDKQKIRATVSSASTNAAEEIVRTFPGDIQIVEFESESRSDEIPSDQWTVRFYASGMNDGFTLTLRDEKERRTRITCHPVTGKVEVEEQ
jgi:general secretion pathway protein H